MGAPPLWSAERFVTERSSSRGAWLVHTVVRGTGPGATHGCLRRTVHRGGVGPWSPDGVAEDHKIGCYGGDHPMGAPQRSTTSATCRQRPVRNRAVLTRSEPSGGGQGQRNGPSPEGGLGSGPRRARERVVSARKLPRRGPPISDTRLRFLRRVSTWKLPFPARRRGSRGSVSCRGSRVSGALPCQGRRGKRKLRGIRNRRSRRTRGDPAAAAPGVRCARRCRGERVGRERRQGGQRSLWRRRGETRRRSDPGRRRVVGQGFEGRASCAAAEARSTRRPWTWSPA